MGIPERSCTRHVEASGVPYAVTCGLSAQSAREFFFGDALPAHAGAGAVLAGGLPFAERERGGTTLPVPLPDSRKFFF